MVDPTDRDEADEGAEGDDGDGDELTTFPVAHFDPTPAPEASFVATVVSGPDAGRSWEIDGSAASGMLIGTSPSCDICLTDRHVSRRHVKLDLERDLLRVVDLDSSNGTRLACVRVRDVSLAGGEELAIGQSVLRFDRGPKAERALPSTMSFGSVVGASREMRRLYPLLARLAAVELPVVIEGETGTGKEAVAESIHMASPRRKGPFVVFDCTAVPATLLESELFGHERGAFTGAVSTRKGVFEQAHGGTLLIDEIGDLELSLQPKLLRALERSEVRRVGGDRWISVDVRVLSATRRDLDREISAGRFRDDLYHRLAVARVELPSLRRRRGDVPLLVAHFCEALGGHADRIPSRVIDAWSNERWPGNVRELRNAVARYLALGELSRLVNDAESTVPHNVTGDSPEDWLEGILARSLPLAEARERVLAIFERRYVEAMLAQQGGSVVKAAEAAGVARRYFQVLKAKYGAKR